MKTYVRENFQLMPGCGRRTELITHLMRTVAMAHTGRRENPTESETLKEDLAGLNLVIVTT